MENVKTIDDLKSLKISNYKHRHILKTKNYIGTYF